MASLQRVLDAVIETNAAADAINITTSGDGPTAKININGGTGTDTLILDAGGLPSSSTVSPTPKLMLAQGWRTSQKISASDVSVLHIFGYPESE